MGALSITKPSLCLSGSALIVPAVIAAAGDRAAARFVEFFTATIRNPNTRLAYGRAVGAFLSWCEGEGLAFDRIGPVIIAGYVETLLADGMAKPSVKQHLAAIRMMFDFMVTGGILPFNPAASVRGPKHVVKVGKTPVLQPDEARALLDSIDVGDLSGLRDRALLGVMVFSFARVSAVVGMDAGDYYQQGKRWWLRLHEKGGKEHAVPVHHKAEEYLDAYLAALGHPTKGPLWRSMTKKRGYGKNRMGRVDVFRMVKRRCAAAEMGGQANCHTFRATGITAYLLNGGSIEGAQAIAAHESPRTTKLYDRTADDITLAEIERIAI
jgi:site-specific recombinase XerD